MHFDSIPLPVYAGLLVASFFCFIGYIDRCRKCGSWKTNEPCTQEEVPGEPGKLKVTFFRHCRKCGYTEETRHHFETSESQKIKGDF